MPMEPTEKIYIERQKNYTKQRGTFGPTGSISANGCGAIAVYNVLIHFEVKADFMDIVERFNRQWLFSTSFGGFMGSYIFYLAYKIVANETSSPLPNFSPKSFINLSISKILSFVIILKLFINELIKFS